MVLQLTAPSTPALVHFTPRLRASRPGWVVASPGVLSREECVALQLGAMAVGSSRGWTDRGASLPTDDIAVRDLALKQRLLVQSKLAVLASFAKTLLGCELSSKPTEAFIICYGGPDQQINRRSGAHCALKAASYFLRRQAN